MMCERAIIMLAILFIFFLQPAPSQAVDLPASGQTACYDAGGALISCNSTGQDGDTLSGTPWPEPRFIDNENGTVTDHLTGLIWSADADCAASVGYDPGEAGAGLLTWPQALEYVALINDGIFPACGLGFSDWRLPNVLELESLVHGEGNTTTWLESRGFGNVASGGYWSSTSDPRDTSNAFFVTLGTGAVSSAWKPATVAPVWLVRGGPTDGLEHPAYPANPHATGQTACWDENGAVTECLDSGQDGELQAGVAWPNPRFTDNEDGTVTDELTGWQWLQNANCIASAYPGIAADGGVVWQTALDFVAGINDATYPDCAAGKSDWQLPNRKQLLSLMDFSQYDPSLPTGHPFLNPPDASVPSGYWTSTTYPTNTAWAWHLYHRAGHLGGAPKTTYAWLVWPVRSASTTPPPNVEIPDAALESAIRDALDLPTGDITPEDLATLTVLELNGLNISDLTGLEYCIGLETLILSNNLIINVSPLSNLTNLTFLNLYDNQIVDITDLGGLIGLEYLNLGRNLIIDIEPLNTLVNLVSLYLDDNQISDITALAAFDQLVDLGLSNNAISDLGALLLNSGLGAGDRLWIEGNPLDLSVGSDASHDIRTLLDLGLDVNHDPMQNMFNDANLEAVVREALNLPDVMLLPEDMELLIELDASSQTITDVEGLQYATSLTALYLQDNQITGINPLASLIQLATLNLAINQVDDLTPLNSLANLTWLNLSSNQIDNITPLSPLTTLTHLFLADNLVADVAALSGLNELAALSLSNNDIFSLGPLVANAGLGSGDTIWLESNPLQLQVGALDVDHIWTLEENGATVHHDPITFNDTALGNAIAQELEKPLDEITRMDLQTMRVLVAQNFGIVDLSGIELMESLESLHLNDNQVSNLALLSGLTNLQIVNLENNNVSDLSPLATISTLSQLRLDGNPVSDLTPLVNNAGLAGGDLVWLHDMATAIDPGTPMADQVWTLRTRGVIVFHEPISGLFADENLEAAVAAALEVNPSELHAAPWLLDDLVVLQADNAEIVNISGIEGCLNLTNLRLRGNQITDISSVPLLPALNSLDLWGNKIVDISPFSQSHHLQLINLGWNLITDLEVFQSIGMGGTTLTLIGNPLDLWVGSEAVDIMYELHQHGTTVFHDPFYFRDPALETAVLEALPTQDPPYISLYTLDDMTEVTIFGCSDRLVFDLTGIANFSNLRSLTAEHNQIDDLTPLAGMEALGAVFLDYNRIADITPLASLPNLSNLQISHNLILDLGPLWNTQSLTYIRFTNNSVAYLDPLCGLSNLKSIQGDNNQISVLGPLADNLNLTHVYLIYNDLDLTIGSDTVNQLLILHQRGVNVAIDGLSFRDPALDVAVRNMLGLAEGEDMLLSHLDQLAATTSLTVANGEFEDPFGLVYAFPLLEVLDLQGNHLVNTGFLEQLPHLRNVVLSNNWIVDIAPLLANAGLATGDRLWLEGNFLPLWQGSETLQMIDDLRSRGVTVHHDPISSHIFTDPILEAAVRQKLGIDDNTVMTESMLGSIKELSVLVSGVADLEGMQYCSNLETLELYRCEVSDLSLLRYLTKLQKLVLFTDTISDIAVLGDLPLLNTVNLLGNPIVSLAPLAQLSDLSELTITGQHLIDFSPFADMANLTHLACYNSLIEDLAVISHMTNLTYLDLAYSDQLQDISPLSSLDALSHLDLRESLVSDLAPLRDLTSLHWVLLDQTPVSDIEPLVDNSGFAEGDYLRINNTSLLWVFLSDDVQNILALEARGVTVSHDPIYDYDGVPESEEHGPNGNDEDYDGNGDNIPDEAQAHVASLHSFDGDHYVTLEVSQPAWFAGVTVEENPSPENMPPEVEAPLGFFSFRIDGVPDNGPAIVRLFLEEGTRISSYWKYGPTPDNANDHWYEFIYDGQTGAEINGNVITLHFVNGQRGDALLLDSAILDPGAPVVSSTQPSNSSGSGSGCFISTMKE